jgi:hypothetical protein
MQSPVSGDGKEVAYEYATLLPSSGRSPTRSTIQKIYKPKRIVPYITRLVGDPTGKEAGWETTIGDTKHVNQYIN